MKDSKKEIADFAIKQLKDAITDLQNGKTPQMSRKLKKLASTLNNINQKLNDNKITENDMDAMIDYMAKDISVEKKDK